MIELLKSCVNHRILFIRGIAYLTIMLMMYVIFIGGVFVVGSVLGLLSNLLYY